MDLAQMEMMITKLIQKQKLHCTLEEVFRKRSMDQMMQERNLEEDQRKRWGKFQNYQHYLILCHVALQRAIRECDALTMWREMFSQNQIFPLKIRVLRADWLNNLVLDKPLQSQF